MLKAFPKIHALGTRHAQTIFDGPVEVTEKIDGSQFVFGKVDGEILFRSKGAQIFVDDPQKMFEAGVEQVLGMDLPEDVVFYGEYLSKPKHNTLAYESIPEGHIALFGMSNPRGDTFSDKREPLVEMARRLNIDPIPLVHEGLCSADLVMKMLERESYLGGPHVEGVVVKAYKDYVLAGQIVPVMAAKYVSEAFKEVHRKSWSKTQTKAGKWDGFKESFRTEARWQKAVQHLAEAGLLENDPRDIGRLITEIKRDITEEEQENIRDFLWREFGEELLRKSTAGFPEWYKERLARSLDEAA